MFKSSAPTTVSLHYLDSYEMCGVKAKNEVYKDTAYCFEQILEAGPNKTSAVRLLPYHPTNHLMKKTCEALVEK